MEIFTHVMSYDVDWDRLGTKGRAPRTRETLPDFRESGQVTRHSRVFRRLTGSQRTPRLGVSQCLVEEAGFLCHNTLKCIVTMGARGKAWAVPRHDQPSHDTVTRRAAQHL